MGCILNRKDGGKIWNMDHSTFAHIISDSDFADLKRKGVKILTVGNPVCQGNLFSHTIHRTELSTQAKKMCIQKIVVHNVAIITTFDQLSYDKMSNLLVHIQDQQFHQKQLFFYTLYCNQIN